MKIFHVSDLHFHRNDSDNAGANAALKTILGAFDGDSVLVVTGDITDDGHATQYSKALAALQPFVGKTGKPQVVVAPGNHDFGAAGNFYEASRARRFDEVICKGLDQPGAFAGDQGPNVQVVSSRGTEVMFIALDSNLETEHPFDFACGEIGEGQLRALDRLLATRSTTSMKKVVLLHHHPFVRNDPFMELKDARAFWRTVFGRVDVVSFGHKHVFEKWTNQNGVALITAADNLPGKNFVHRIDLQAGQPPTWSQFQVGAAGVAPVTGPGGQTVQA